MSNTKSTNNFETGWQALYYMLVGFLIISPARVASRGFVVAKLWEWYVTPYFEAPSIGIVLAMGLSLLLQIGIGGDDLIREYDPEEENALIGKLIGKGIGSVVLAFAVLAAGWVLKMFL